MRGIKYPVKVLKLPSYLAHDASTKVRTEAECWSPGGPTAQSVLGKVSAHIYAQTHSSGAQSAWRYHDIISSAIYGQRRCSAAEATDVSERSGAEQPRKLYRPITKQTLRLARSQF